MTIQNEALIWHVNGVGGTLLLEKIYLAFFNNEKHLKIFTISEL